MLYVLQQYDIVLSKLESFFQIGVRGQVDKKMKYIIS